METTDAQVDRMDGAAAAHRLDDVVAQLLQPQRLFHQRPVHLGQFQRIGEAEEIGGVQHVDVQGVAFQPLAAIDQPAQVADGLGHGDAQDGLHGLGRPHHVGDGADAADAGGDVGHLGIVAALEEGLEETRRLEDAEMQLLHLAVADLDRQRALALDAGQGLDLDGAGVSHGGRPPCGTRRHWR
ncbi:MAG: hypothetical protein NVV74_11675 [Magnetospirillum sp.]|nr:hypothetical protein [Magnetospirillum sp.]